MSLIHQKPIGDLIFILDYSDITKELFSMLKLVCAVSTEECKDQILDFYILRYIYTLLYS